MRTEIGNVPSRLDTMRFSHTARRGKQTCQRDRISRAQGIASRGPLFPLMSADGLRNRRNPHKRQFHLFIAYINMRILSRIPALCYFCEQIARLSMEFRHKKKQFLDDADWSIAATILYHYNH